LDEEGKDDTVLPKQSRAHRHECLCCARRSAAGIHGGEQSRRRRANLLDVSKHALAVGLGGADQSDTMPSLLRVKRDTPSFNFDYGAPINHPFSLTLHAMSGRGLGCVCAPVDPDWIRPPGRLGSKKLWDRSLPLCLGRFEWLLTQRLALEAAV
jgi:hypothetical protein